MAKTFTATARGRNRSWTIEIDTPGTGSATIKVEDSLRLVYGAPGLEDWGDEVLPSSMRLRIEDTATNELWTGILAAGDDWDTDVRIYSDEATPTYEWHGIVQVGSVLRPKFTDMRGAVLDLYVYDGIEAASTRTLAEDSGISNVYGYVGILQIIARALNIARNGTAATGGNALNIDAVFDLAAESGSGDWASDLEIKQFKAFRGVLEQRTGLYSVRNPKGKVAGFGGLSWGTLLRQLAQVFGLRVYQQFWNYDAVATFPRWNVIHRNATGTAVTQGDNGSISVSNSTNIETAAPAGGIGVDSSGDTALAATQDADIMFTKLPALKRVEFEVNLPSDLHAATVVSRDARPGALGDAWIIDSGTPSIDATPVNGTGYNHIVMTHGESVVLYGPRVATGWGQGLNVQMRVKGNTTTLDVITAGGDLTATLSNRDGGTGGGTASVQFTGTTSQETLDDNNDMTEFSEDGQIKIVLDYDDLQAGAGLDIEISDIYIEIRDSDTSDPMTNWTAPVDSAVATIGEKLVIDTQIASVGYSTDLHTDIYLTNDGAADDIGNWQIEGAGTVYYDILHAAAAFLLSMRETPPDVLTGRLDGLYPPERSLRTENADGGTSDFFVGSGVELDLLTETTYGTWIENLNKR